MLSFIGAHYAELVILAMTAFAVALFSASVHDNLRNRQKPGR